MNYQTHQDDTSFEHHYAAAAGTIRNHLSFLYSRISGVEPTHWETRTYENGLLLITPVAGNKQEQSKYDESNPGEIFLKAVGRTSEAFAATDDESEIIDLLRQAGEKAQAVSEAIE